MPSRMKRPSEMFSTAMGRSPCTTCISTLVWSSLAVVKTWLLRTGMVAFRRMRRLAAPPFAELTAAQVGDPVVEGIGEADRQARERAIDGELTKLDIELLRRFKVIRSCLILIECGVHMGACKVDPVEIRIHSL